MRNRSFSTPPGWSRMSQIWSTDFLKIFSARKFTKSGEGRISSVIALPRAQNGVPTLQYRELHQAYPARYSAAGRRWLLRLGARLSYVLIASTCQENGQPAV